MTNDPRSNHAAQAVAWLRATPGATQSQAAKRFGITQAAVSRHMARPGMRATLRRVYDVALANGYDEIAELCKGVLG